MIREFSVRPKPQNNYAVGISLASLVSATLLFILQANMERYRGVVGLLAICFLTASIFIAVKYTLTEYIYDITFDADGRPVFVVRSVTGKRASTLCRVDLSHITAVEREEPTDRRKHKTNAGYKK